MFEAVLVIHVLLCIGLVGLVLVQQGKGAEAGAIMGSGADAIVGAGSAGNVLSRATTGLAIAFMISSIILVRAYGGRGDSVMVPTREFSPLEGSAIVERLAEETKVVEGDSSEVEVPLDLKEQSEALDGDAEGTAAVVEDGDEVEDPLVAPKEQSEVLDGDAEGAAAVVEDAAPVIVEEEGGRSGEQ